MIKLTKNGKINTAIVVLLLSVMFTRYIDYRTNTFTGNTIICFLFTVIAFLWIYQIRNRVTHPAEKRCLIAIAVLNLSLIVIRTVKYVFIIINTDLERYCWYMYYIPVILSVLFMFYATFYVGKTYDRKMSIACRLLVIPAVLLCIIIMTNDLHMGVFYFYDGLEHWSDKTESYKRGIFFFLIMGWIFLMIGATMFNVFRKCLVAENRKKLWITLLPLVLGVLLFVLQNEDSLLKIPEIHCMLYPCIMESLILAGLIPSNSRYNEAWNISSINFGMMNMDNRIVQRKGNGMVSPEQILSSVDKSSYIWDKNHEMKSCRITGGYGFWIRDIHELNRLKVKLLEYGDVLSEENAMLKAEQKLEEEKLVVSEQNRIYNSIVKKVYPELLEIHRILKDEHQEEDEFRRNITYASVLNVYVKRYSNMILTSSDEILPAEELKFAVRESLEYVSLLGIKTHGEYDLSGNGSSSMITGLYEFYQKITWDYVIHSKGILVHLSGINNDITMYIETDGAMSEQEMKNFKEDAGEKGIHLTIENEDNTLYFTLKTGSDTDDDNV